MYVREGEGGGVVRGVLCDWDLAYDPEDPYPQPSKTLKATATSHKVINEIVVEKHDPNVHVGPCYRTGTGPFMAVDLLAEGEVPPHQYRHDLESFFFLLVWFCAAFDPDNHELGHLTNWEMSDLVQIGTNKCRFLKKRRTQEKIFELFHDEYKPLITLWIKPLIKVFWSVNVKREVDKEDCEFILDQAESNELSSARKDYMERMKAIEDERNAAVSYERFMECLRIDITAVS